MPNSKDGTSASALSASAEAADEKDSEAARPSTAAAAVKNPLCGVPGHKRAKPVTRDDDVADQGSATETTANSAAKATPKPSPDGATPKPPSIKNKTSPAAKRENRPRKAKQVLDTVPAERSESNPSKQNVSPTKVDAQNPKAATQAAANERPWPGADPSRKRKAEDETEEGAASTNNAAASAAEGALPVATPAPKKPRCPWQSSSSAQYDTDTQAMRAHARGLTAATSAAVGKPPLRRPRPLRAIAIDCLKSLQAGGKRPSSGSTEETMSVADMLTKCHELMNETGKEAGKSGGGKKTKRGRKRKYKSPKADDEVGLMKAARDLADALDVQTEEDLATATNTPATNMPATNTLAANIPAYVPAPAAAVYPTVPFFSMIPPPAASVAAAAAAFAQMQQQQQRHLITNSVVPPGFSAHASAASQNRLNEAMIEKAKSHADLVKTTEKLEMEKEKFLKVRKELSDVRKEAAKQKAKHKREVKKLEGELMRWRSRAEYAEKRLWEKDIAAADKAVADGVQPAIVAKEYGAAAYVNALTPTGKPRASRGAPAGLHPSIGPGAAATPGAKTGARSPSAEVPEPPPRKIEPEATWEKRFAELEHFKKGYSHTRVPVRYENKALARWVQAMRMEYRMLKKMEAEGRGPLVEDVGQDATREEEENQPVEGNSGGGASSSADANKLGMYSLNRERIAKLNDLGFVWQAVTHEKRPWEVFYGKLVDFNAEHGHTRVPRTYRVGDLKLGEWCHTQRQGFRNSKRYPIYRVGGERHTKLLAIGFELQCENMMHKKSWDDRFGQLLDYRRKFGHCNVTFVDPMADARSKRARGASDGEDLAEGGNSVREEVDEDEEDLVTGSGTKSPCPDGICDSAIDRRAFGRWIKQQRAEYVKFMHGKKVKALDKNRIRRLNEVGFDWGYAVEAAKRDPTPSRPGAKQNRVAWDARFSQLCEFVTGHGNTRVPQGWKENPQLAHWVAEQRKQYRFRSLSRPNSMSDERIARLESIDFEWSIQDHSKRWKLGGKKKREEEEVASQEEEEEEEENESEEDTEDGEDEQGRAYAWNDTQRSRVHSSHQQNTQHSNPVSTPNLDHQIPHQLGYQSVSRWGS